VSRYDWRLAEAAGISANLSSFHNFIHLSGIIPIVQPVFSMTTKPNQSLPLYQFTTTEYHRLGEAGILEESRRVELLNGNIIEISPINSPHARTVKQLNRLLSKIFGEQAIISVQEPVQLDEHSEPEPDLAVLVYRADLYTQSHPRPSDTLLIIEVADASLEKDRQVKLPLYAAAGIPEVWIVNLPDQQIEIYTQARQDGYADIHLYRRGEIITTKLVQSVEVDAVLIAQ
jgi:Uma2 family endonuclease